MNVPTLSSPARVLSATLAALAIVLGLAVSPAAAACTAATPEDGYRMLFDGTQESLAGWQQAGPGSFELQTDCSIKSVGGLGLLWHTEQFDSYTLKLDWKLEKVLDNSGIFVGFPSGGDNTHNTAISKGYEIQIDQFGRSDGQPRHYTGAIYDIQGPNRDTRLEGTDSFGWNTYEITVDAPKIIVELNDVVVNEFTSVDIARDISTGHVGLQNHGGPDTAFFRNVQIKEIEPGSVGGGGGGGGGGGEPQPEAGPLEALRNNTGIAQDPSSGADFDGVGYSYSAAAFRLAGVTPGGQVSADGMTFTWPQTASGAADNVLARGQTLQVDAPAGAQRISFLAAANHGPSVGTFGFNYSYTDADGVARTTTVQRDLAISDWTLNGGGGSPAPGNVVAITTEFRMLASAAPEPTNAVIFAVSAPLEPGMKLTSVTLPNGYTGGIHLFAVAVK